MAIIASNRKSILAGCAGFPSAGHKFVRQCTTFVVIYYNLITNCLASALLI